LFPLRRLVSPDAPDDFQTTPDASQISPDASSGNLHLVGVCGYPLAVAIPIFRVSAWKNAIGTMNICVAFIDGFHSKKGHGSPSGP